MDANTAVFLHFVPVKKTCQFAGACHTNDFLGDVSNVAPVSSTFPWLAYISCMFLVSRMEPVAESFSIVCKFLSCFEQMHEKICS